MSRLSQKSIAAIVEELARLKATEGKLPPEVEIDGRTIDVRKILTSAADITTCASDAAARHLGAFGLEGFSIATAARLLLAFHLLPAASLDSVDLPTRS